MQKTHFGQIFLKNIIQKMFSDNIQEKSVQLLYYKNYIITIIVNIINIFLKNR